VKHVQKHQDLFNFEPPATEQEIRAASLQFVRKLSGFTAPSKANQAAFDRAVEEVAAAAGTLIESLVTTADPRDREIEAERARARSAVRFGRRRDAARRTDLPALRRTERVPAGAERPIRRAVLVPGGGLRAGAAGARAAGAAGHGLHLRALRRCGDCAAARRRGAG
jgi:hypothetical protein